MDGQYPAEPEIIKKRPSIRAIHLIEQRVTHCRYSNGDCGGSADNDICRIYPVQIHGYNYSVFRIKEVLTMEEVKAMALMHGKQEKKSVDDLDF